MNSKIIAIVLNSIFGMCLCYCLLTLWFMCASQFVIEIETVIIFSLFNIIWLVSDITFNYDRYQKQGAGRFFWLTIILPPIIILVLAGLIYNNI